MKKKGLKIIVVFFIFAFIMGNLTVVFADEYKGYKADGPWDAFYNYFIATWSKDQSKLTTKELKRFVAGPTKKEKDLAKEGRGPTIFPSESGIIDDVTNLIQTREKSDNSSGKIDDKTWQQKNKEVRDLYYNKLAKEKDKNNKKKINRLLSTLKCTSIYLTRQNNDEADYYDGSKWGLNFKITLSELDFYNSYKSNIIEKLNENFERIK